MICCRRGLRPFLTLFTKTMASHQSGWLAGKRVLVTRPAAQAGGLIRAVENQGGIAIACPMVAIEPLPEKPTSKQKIINFDQYDGVIVVSRNAAQMALDWLDQYWPQLPAHQQWFVVGEGTANCLRNAGIEPLVPTSGFNSEALLEFEQLQQLEQQRFLIFKGEGGRELLTQQLENRGAVVDWLELYRRVTVNYTDTQLSGLFSHGGPDALVATSSGILTAMDSQLADALPMRLELPLVVVSQRIAEIAKQLGYRHVFTSPSPADDSIVATLNVIG